MDQTLFESNFDAVDHTCTNQARAVIALVPVWVYSHQASRVDADPG